jgi:hypothetical protein
MTGMQAAVVQRVSTFPWNSKYSVKKCQHDLFLEVILFIGYFLYKETYVCDIMCV